MKLEVCCGSFADACAAERGGASRIELNSALSIGGLIPDIGSVLLCKEHLDEFLAMRKMKDYTAKGNGVSFAYEGSPDWYCYEAVSEDEVRKLWNSICRYYNENMQ